jgi:hypothetical protein
VTSCLGWLRRLVTRREAVADGGVLVGVVQCHSLRMVTSCLSWPPGLFGGL